MGSETEEMGTQGLEANTDVRHFVFSRAESAVVPFEEREGMEGEHTPETDLTWCYQVLEGDKIERRMRRRLQYV